MSEENEENIGRVSEQNMRKGRELAQNLMLEAFNLKRPENGSKTLELDIAVDDTNALQTIIMAGVHIIATQIVNEVNAGDDPAESFKRVMDNIFNEFTGINEARAESRKETINQ
jgi:hypothetical protein